MNRLVRSIAIGGGAACIVGSGLYFLQHKINMSKLDLPITMSSEWGFKTRQHVFKASQSYDNFVKIKEYEQALDTLVSPNTNLNTKSADWLAGYADLLRALGLSLIKDQPENAISPLKSAATIPLGNADLRAQAQLALYDLTKDKTILLGSEDVTPLEAPQTLDTANQIKAWAPLLLAQAQTKFTTAPQSCLAELLELHRKIKESDIDLMCFKAQCGGYIAQLLWKQGRKQDASKWLQVSLDSVQCKTPSCVATQQTLQDLMVKAVKSSS